MLNSVVGDPRALFSAAPSTPATVTVPPGASLIMAQGFPTTAAAQNGFDGSVTVITAPNALLLKASAACLIDPEVWSRIDGRFAFLDASDGSLETVAPRNVELVETKTRSLSNIRLVTAGWLSMNPAIYVALTLGLALLLGLTTTSLVPQYRPEKRMTRTVNPILGLVFGAALAVASPWIVPARAQDGASPVPPATAIPGAPTAKGEAMPGASKPAVLADSLKNPDAWRSYRSRFITEAGRVVDTANGMISHSEGQGYGMLLAVAANDRTTFERLWGWTRANLMVRSDELLAWRWEPGKRPAVADLNDASDGDILVAWALTEAAEAWDEASYRVAAAAHRRGGRAQDHPVQGQERGTAAAGGLRLLRSRTRGRAADQPLLLGVPGLRPAPHRGPRIRLGGPDRQRLNLIRRSRFGTAKAADRMDLPEGRGAASGGWIPRRSSPTTPFAFPSTWSGGCRAPSDYDPFVALWSGPDRERLPIVDTSDGRTVESLSESGYTALSGAAPVRPEGHAAARRVRDGRRGTRTITRRRCISCRWWRCR